MADLQGFNAETVEPQGSFDPIPAGWYTGMIVSSEMKQTKNGNGQYLQLRIDVIEGEHEGRVIFDRLNLINDNQTAVEIAQRQLSAICRAVGVMQPRDSADLHDKPLRVKLSIRPAGNGYDASNEVKAYEAVEGGTWTAPGAQTHSTAPQQDQQGPAPQANKKPWQ